MKNLSKFFWGIEEIVVLLKGYGIYVFIDIAKYISIYSILSSLCIS